MTTTPAMTPKEFAAFYRISVKTVHRQKAAGTLPFFRIGRRIFLLPINETTSAKHRAK